MITNMRGNSGGTGVVIATYDSKSEILTNAHVCGVIKQGGFVNKDGEKFQIMSYRQDDIHDLCILVINRRLEAKASVSSWAPRIGDGVETSGHPRLLPNILSGGHIAGTNSVTIMVGLRECTKEDMKTDIGIFCLFMQGIPILRTYDAVVVSALIQPGSSGSAVYNSAGRLVGLVFAGSGDLSYGLVVPWEYVKNFVDKWSGLKRHSKYKTIEYTTEVTVEMLMGKSARQVDLIGLTVACSKAPTDEVRKVCIAAIRTIQWRQGAL
jgi:S1-C subfamily serine protease